MFRNLSMLRNQLALHRVLVARSTLHSKMSTGLTCLTIDRPRNIDGVTVIDININEMAKNDVEFNRNFVNSLTLMDRSPFNAVDAADAVESPPAENSIPGDTVEILPTGAPSSVIGVDGSPIVPIEIDGWNQDEEDPTVQKNVQDVDIGNDDEYKAEMELRVPEVREGRTEYKGIKVTLPESANQDVGTYRFRRDPKDLKEVGDDTRLVRYDK
ncbi:uncharacterized protein LOC6732968 [Drosophila simulans]|uniref:GD21693 n=1 Tax=Drosophila simulans TaxID=7240 RepID=B4Q3F4_DROSI|nr:uncharacterized protein LOC6732968 [Drosophila simulans]EDX05635.1 GD21693 [Drosophila simulans]KMY91177.1 uncharacterized protein Dsimw501_GD21693 [Drosophila simulans]